MAKMSDYELLAILEEAYQDAAIFNGEFMSANERLLADYLQDPYGDEVEDQSQVVSPDVQNVVESDMPSLVRTFLGANEIMTFEPLSNDDNDIREAEEKTKYVNWIVRGQPGSFQTIHNWMKDAEIQKNGVVKYFIEEETTTTEESFSGVNQSELAEIEQSLQGHDVSKIEIVGRSEGDELEVFDVTFRVTRTCKEIKIINIPTESFLISKNSSCVDDAMLVGDRVRKTRGQLLAEGFDRDLIESLPTIDTEQRQESNIKNIRNYDQGGGTYESDVKDWAGQEVELRDLYIRIDFDGDGIAERRHILISGNRILENEPFDHVPYASLSSILMPHKAIGRSRAEVTQTTQRVKTVLLRQTLNNIYAVNNPRHIVHGAVDLDDMLTMRPNGIVRMDDDTEVLPAQAVAPLEIPYIGDRSLQIIQYMDQIRSQTTGTLLASQGLQVDDINSETATRFNGVMDEGEAKIELVARNFAETGFRKLYEGIAWLASKFQDTQQEIRILGKQLTVNPANWKYNHKAASNVGLGIGDSEKMAQSMQGIYAIQQQLAQTGSPLVDQVKIYNALDKLMKSMDMPRSDLYFNNPEVPQELLKAENELLRAGVDNLTQQLEAAQNPLAEAEQIKAQASLIQAEGKRELDIAKMLEEQRRFNLEMQQERAEFLQKSSQFQQELALKIAELEQKFNTNITIEQPRGFNEQANETTGSGQS